MVMTLDQFICVKFPLRSAAICTASRAKKIIIIVPLAVSFYCIPQFLYAASVKPTCIGMNVNNTFSVIYSWITVSMNSFVPFVVVFTLNLAIILEMRKKSSIVIEGQSVREKESLNSLLLISFTFLLFTLPLHIRYIYYQYHNKYASLKALSDFFLAYHFTAMLHYTNNAINFLLYTCGGSKFRQDFKLIVCSCFGRSRSGNAGKCSDKRHDSKMTEMTQDNANNVYYMN
ncbi:hypothetical protein CAPTEDRAFT_193608 [Capitella teleta]|uniref:G-protein coupled receptors family 1 profile domain-containing protein n=1 Tax=Capitella teleta TaxID=283909 RepID=R7VJI5_CAPTE|nr:hypothetical protein CAPTEDRAFT_193608 [Capitella teleta]|eukprot:ELU15955.1 hypothetical protein CAPTEDRAFT_193608 [Capitella teleta]